MKIHNTLTKTREVFQTLVPGKVTIYMCGITVYNLCHLGHARTQMAADFIVRYLAYQKYDITWVRNITDIDDKIIQAASKLQLDIHTLSSQMITAMQKDFKALGLLEPEHQPRATEYLPEMIAMIKELINKGNAYVHEGSVWFNIASYPEYGCFRHPTSKSSEADFVLWKKAKPEEPSYPSPWGAGRPGWHIECSAMSKAFLGERFDIHLGGKDLIFPHHENEIAQSFNCHGCIPARYWMHIGLLQIEGRKMSKSLNNFIDIKSLLSVYSAQDIRFFFLQTHYRHDATYTTEHMESSATAFKNLVHSLRRHPEVIGIDNSVIQAFELHMNDDFNTPEVCALLFRCKKLWNSTNCSILGNTILLILETLGFNFETNLSIKEIEELIFERANCKLEGNFSRADEIRGHLAHHDVFLSDVGSKTHWYIKK